MGALELWDDGDRKRKRELALQQTGLTKKLRETDNDGIIEMKRARQQLERAAFRISSSFDLLDATTDRSGKSLKKIRREAAAAQDEAFTEIAVEMWRHVNVAAAETLVRYGRGG